MEGVAVESNRELSDVYALAVATVATLLDLLSMFVLGGVSLQFGAWYDASEPTKFDIGHWKVITNGVIFIASLHLIS